MTTPAPTIDDLNSMADGLLDTWAALPTANDGKFRMKAKNKGRTAEPQFLTTYALAAHVYELARTVLPLLREGKSTASAPLVRSIYETALTAHWVAQAADGAEGFFLEEQRQRRALRGDLRKAVSERFRESAETIAHLDLNLPETPDQDSARSFAALCEDLEPGGTDAYIWYRLLCQFTHPSALVTDEYLDEEDDQIWLCVEPKNDNTELWLYLTTVSMVWAARAVTFMEEDPAARRNYLRAVARRLGVSPELQLSARYRQRRQRAKVAKRAAGTSKVSKWAR